MNKYFKSLDILPIIAKIQSFLHTKKAFLELENIKFYTDFDEFSIEHNILDDAINCFYKNGSISFYNIDIIDSELKYAEKGGTISVEAIKNIYFELLNVQEIKKYEDKFMSFYTHLKAICEGLNPLYDLCKNIYSVFNEEFLIRDNASSELSSIRKELRKIENSLKNQIIKEMNIHSECLIDQSYSIRNSTFVLPVKTAYKNKVKGLIHDISSSGETTFIEPESVLLLSNLIQELQAKEKEEISRILLVLSNAIGDKSNEIMINDSIITKLDILNAKFLFTKQIDGMVIPTFNDSRIEIINARHPLIDKSIVIPNDIKLSCEENQLIISGPNAGGKSVLLKLIGLTVLLNQLIIPLPLSERSSIGFFKHIFIDIGDFQSIQENLSTFSAHILNVSNIINSVSSDDLVLIDELGTGTDPKEGESLAISIATYLNNKKCKSFITSHFDGMKHYALATDGVTCGSMIFDEITLTPKYRLAIGYPGKSYGISIAKKYGMNKEIINSAINNLKNQKTNEEDYIEMLNKKINSASEIEKRNIELEKELKDTKRDFNNKTDTLNKKIEKFNEEAKIEKEKIIQETQEKLDDLKKVLLKNGTIKLNDVIDAQKDLANLLDQDIEFVQKESQIIEKVSIGDYVSNSVFGIEGKVVSIGKKGISILTSGGKSYIFSPEDVKKIPNLSPNFIKNEDKNTHSDTSILSIGISSELNLIGLHVDEAINALEIYLDKAHMKQMKSARIIHGFGTGALRKAVHSYLKKCKFVKEFSLGGEFDGGMGATIVTFK